MTSLSRLTPWVAAGVVNVVAGISQAAIYGGPTNNTSVNTGYSNPAAPVGPGATAGNGAGTGYVSKSALGRSQGTRAVRWDNTGAAAVELGNLGLDVNGAAVNNAFAINPAGTVVGSAQKIVANVGLGQRATRWDAGVTTATELGNLGTDASGNTNSVAYALNASGTAVGYATKYTASIALGDRAVRWDAGGTTATELGNLGLDGNNATTSYAYAISSTGTAVGYAFKYVNASPRGSRAVRWDADGTAATELGNLGTSTAGATTSYAYAVNTAGTAVGFATKFVNNSNLADRAVRWDAGTATATELGNLGTSNPNGTGGTISYAYGINTAGTAVGYAYKYVNGNNFGFRAVRWDAGGTAATELGNLGTDASGTTNSYAYSINATGTTVGYAAKYTGGGNVGNRAVAWEPDGNAIDLNKTLTASDAANWTLNTASSISDTNWVTGVGTYDPDGTGPLAAYSRLFLLKLAYRGDATGDDGVDFNDFLVLQNNFNTTATAGDFNYDGVVNFNDFLILQNNFGTSLNGGAVAVTSAQVAAMTAFGESHAVPEPAALAMLSLAAFGLVRRRR